MTNQDALKLARRAQRHLKIAAASNVRVSQSLAVGDVVAIPSLLQRRDHHAKEANKLTTKINADLPASFHTSTRD